MEKTYVTIVDSPPTKCPHCGGFWWWSRLDDGRNCMAHSEPFCENFSRVDFPKLDGKKPLPPTVWILRRREHVLDPRVPRRRHLH